MQNPDEITYGERESIAIMVRSIGWKNLMRLVFTPMLVQTNARLDAMGTPEQQTQFYRGVKHTIKHFMETVYKFGGMPDPFKEYQQAFLVTLAVPTPERVPSQTEELPDEPALRKKRNRQTPVL